jgi:hypothetical protein
MPDDSEYPSPDLMLARYVRRAAASAAVPDPQADVDGGDVPPAVYELRDELKAAQARVKHLEQALRAAGRVLQPYLGGGGR